MQKRAAKFIVLISISFFTAIAHSSLAAPVNLTTADSLFEAKRYTQSLHGFEEIFANQQYTPAMLLKMAYIHEALGNIAKTQYFLSLYFLSTNDDSALEKMETVAEKHQLEGYTFTATDRVKLLVRENATPLVGVMMALILLFLAWIIRLRKLNKRAFIPFAIVFIFCVILVTLLQVTSGDHHSIILQPNTYVMSGPSPGSDVVEILDAGHKVEVVGKKDVWLKIRWRDEEAYLKEDLLQPIVL